MKITLLNALFTTIIILGLVACTPKIDTTNETTRKESIERIRASLSPDRLTAFDDAMTNALCIPRFVDQTELIIRIAPPNRTAINVLPDSMDCTTLNELSPDTTGARNLNGLTGEEVIAKFQLREGEPTLQQRFTQNLISSAKAYRDQVQTEQNEIIGRANEARAVFSSIDVRIEPDANTPEKKLRLFIQNNSTQAIRDITFSVETKGLNRTIPYDISDCAFGFSGGLEPNESFTATSDQPTSKNNILFCWPLSTNDVQNWPDAQRIITIEYLTIADGSHLPRDKPVEPSNGMQIQWPQKAVRIEVLDADIAEYSKKLAAIDKFIANPS